MKRLRRRERRRLAEAAGAHRAAIDGRVKDQAAATARALNAPSPEQIAHWFKHSYGSWKRS